MRKTMAGPREDRTGGEPARWADQKIRSTRDKTAYPERRYVEPRAEVKTLDAAALAKPGPVGRGLTTAWYRIGDAANPHSLTITVRP